MGCMPLSSSCSACSNRAPARTVGAGVGGGGGGEWWRGGGGGGDDN